MIKLKAIRSIEKLVQNEKQLIINDINERTLSHCLACYLADEFPCYNVDVEYNRNLEKDQGEPKYAYIIKEKYKSILDNALANKQNILEFADQVTTYPDIIVHKR